MHDYRAHGRVRGAGARDRARPRRRHPAGDRRSACSAAAARRSRPGVKWRAVAEQPPGPKYVVCNADESEPGTFKDRVLMENDPFAVIEALTIAGFATGAETRLPLHPRRVPARDETPAACDRGGAGGRAARAGRDARGVRLRHRAPARRRRLHLRRGDRAVQLDRGQARRAAEQAAVPRAPTACSGKPDRRSTTWRRWSTCSRSLSSAADAYAALGTEGSTGTRLFCLSGHVEHPGVYEAEHGITLARGDRRWPAACATARRSRRCCSAARRAGSSGRTDSTCG